jgi:hypothetical protein
MPITQDDFKKDFNAHKFIEGITERVLPRALHLDEDRPDMFDPEPLHVAFEHTQKNLHQLRESVDKLILKKSKACQTSEREYKTKVKDLNNTYEKLAESFKSLDTRISIISKKPVRIGQNLESVETERANADKSKKLIQIIMNLNSTDDSRQKSMDELIKLTGSDDFRISMASTKTVKDLLIIAQELDIDQTDRAKNAILTIAKEVEENLLRRFTNATKLGNYATMKEIASILFAFNGGDTCVEAYLDSLDFLKDQPEAPVETKPAEEVKPDTDDDDVPEVEVLDLEMLKAKSQSINTPVEKPKNEPDFQVNKKDLDTFFADLLKNLEEQNRVIQKVFKPAPVMEVLTRRVYTHRIRNFVAQKLSDYRDLDCYLKTLGHAMHKCNDLAEALVPMLPNFNIHIIIMDSVMKEACLKYIDNEVNSIQQFLNSLLEEQIYEKKELLKENIRKWKWSRKRN